MIGAFEATKGGEELGDLAIWRFGELAI